jgi:Dyp-type peroxidase family
MFLVVTVNAGPACDAAVRALCGDLAGLLRAIGFRDLDGRLSCIMGFGSDAWDRLFGAPRPKELHPFREIRGQHHAVATPGDILFHIRAARMDLCFELATQIMSRLGGAVATADEVHGFQYFDDRDLLGFVDGTENPVDQAAVDATLIGEEDAAFAGGSYVIVQKYLHDLAGWNAVPVEEQEKIVGRTKLSDIELDDAVKPTFAHNALTIIEEGGEELKIVRANMPFGEVGKGGVRHLFHRLCPIAAPDRADAREHVRRQAARQLRPAAGFQPGRDRHAVLRADRDVPGGRRARGSGFDRDRSRERGSIRAATVPARWLTRYRFSEKGSWTGIACAAGRPSRSSGAL